MNDSLQPWPQRLRAKVCATGTAAVLGLDPNPAQISDRYGAADGTPSTEAARVQRWCEDMLQQTQGLFPAVKLQSAWFELQGSAGMQAMETTMDLARQADLLVIADVKRGDIGVSAEAYARAWIGDSSGGQPHASPRADAMTVLPWLGDESIQPFRIQCAASGTGAFLCARTSNPGAEMFQEVPVQSEDGESLPAWMAVADLAAKGAAAGESPLGLVVGGGHPEQALAIRARHRGLILLVPGFGAQGGDMSRAADFLEDGKNALFPSSRAITSGKDGKVRQRALDYIQRLQDHS